MRLGLMIVITLGAGCGEDGAGAPGGGGDLGANDGPCYVLADGEWSADGEAFGGPNSAVLTMDAAACTVSLAEWAENPEGPEGAVVEGDQMTLQGKGKWESCVGTVSDDGLSVTGTCDAGDFTLTHAGDGGGGEG